MKRLLFAIVLIAAPFALAQQEAVKVPDADTFVGAPKGQPLAGPPLEQRTQEVAALLRCPVCQGLSVADSPSEMAVNMKKQVRALLARGFTQEQILSYFEHSYGTFILLKPKMQGLVGLVWLFPMLALLIGIVVVVVKMKSLEKAPAPAPQPPPAENNDDPYLDRVRAMVKGD
jgi:cytochrome c-type biogenesis protein CcmH